MTLSTATAPLAKSEVAFYKKMQKKFEEKMRAAVADRNFQRVAELFNWYGTWLQQDPDALRVPIA